MPEHGTWARYQRGCHCEACTAGARNYQKRRVLDAERGQPRMVNGTPTHRKIEALGALGWTYYDIGLRAGKSREWVRQIVIRDMIRRSTATAIDELYGQMCMALPPRETRYQRHAVARQLGRARRLGWLPPLAWEDVDAGVIASTEPDDAYDEALVTRILSGEWRLPAEQVDRMAVMERFSGSLSELERLTGWNVWRDRREAS